MVQVYENEVKSHVVKTVVLQLSREILHDKSLHGVQIVVVVLMADDSVSDAEKCILFKRHSSMMVVCHCVIGWMEIANGSS